MSEFVQELTSDSFDAATADGLVVIDFWAPWCMPCKMMGPIFASVAEKMAANTRFAKVNIDESPDLPARFGIRSIPTFVILKDGKEVATHTGAIRPDELILLINQNR